MQFKYPEVLYFLVLLIIPILVHLFQLQRYKKVPFTNVAFLQKISTENRKSSRIKKWLILATRLSLLAAIIIAFAQPYFGNTLSNDKQNTFIYLDNSLSTTSKGEKGNVLQINTQELIEATSKNSNYSLLTNTNFYKNKTKEELKEILLETKKTAKNITFKDILLKIESQNKSKSNTLTKNILISDFQNINKSHFTNINSDLLLIQQLPEQKNNISIDSIFVSANSSNNIVNVVLKNQGNAKENIPIAIYNGDKLISKQTFNISENNKKEISFSIEKSTSFSGKLSLSLEDTFNFDNNFYFALNSKQKTNVLAIGNNNNFLRKLYSENDFNFTNTTLKNTNYNNLENQQLIILNELEKTPSTLIKSLTDFSKKGGYLIIIPHLKTNIASYNLLFKNLNSGTILPLKTDSLKITTINFKHPLFKKVFDKEVDNFQYPETKNYYPTNFKNASDLLSFENREGFIKQINLANSKLFWVASPLNKSNSNFTNSPLIVPVFYNIGQESLQLSKLSYTINKTNIIEIQTGLGKDDILKIQNKNSSFIPLQKSTQNKTSITTKDQPLINGSYQIVHKKDTIGFIAYNYPKQESFLQFLDAEKIANENENIHFSTSVKDSLLNIDKKNEVQWLWKWFLILAIVSLLLEILILKYFKV